MMEATYVEVCGVEDLWDDEMESFEVAGEEVLLVKYDGQFYAYQGICPHQNIPMVEGNFEGGVLTCRAHHWQFDVRTGDGVNPSNCRLKRFPVTVRDGIVLVGTASS